MNLYFTYESRDTLNSFCLFITVKAITKLNLGHRNKFEIEFSNSLIIHAALTQPEHHILVRWMSLETQWKPSSSWKHGRAWKPCFNLFETRMQIFLICILIKQQKHVAINNYLITHFTKQTLNLNYLLLMLNVTVQLLNYPKQKSPFFF